MCWITGSHTIQPPIEGLLPPTGIEPTPFRDSVSKGAGLQVHATYTLLYHFDMFVSLFGVSGFCSLKKHIFQETPFIGCFSMEPMRYGKQYPGI